MTATRIWSPDKVNARYARTGGLRWAVACQGRPSVVELKHQLMSSTK